MPNELMHHSMCATHCMQEHIACMCSLACRGNMCEVDIACGTAPDRQQCYLTCCPAIFQTLGSQFLTHLRRGLMQGSVMQGGMMPRRHDAGWCDARHCDARWCDAKTRYVLIFRRVPSHCGGRITHIHTPLMCTAPSPKLISLI